MTDQELTAIRERTREKWAKYQTSVATCTDTFQHFKAEADRAEHARQVEEAIKNGQAPF